MQTKEGSDDGQRRRNIGLDGDTVFAYISRLTFKKISIMGIFIDLSTTSL